MRTLGQGRTWLRFLTRRARNVYDWYPWCLRFLVEYTVKDDTGHGGSVANTITALTGNVKPGIYAGGSGFQACNLDWSGNPTTEWKAYYDLTVPVNGQLTVSFQLVYVGGHSGKCSLTVST